jgi:hypothetical protein
MRFFKWEGHNCSSSNRPGRLCMCNPNQFRDNQRMNGSKETRTMGDCSFGGTADDCISRDNSSFDDSSLAGSDSEVSANANGDEEVGTEDPVLAGYESRRLVYWRRLLVLSLAAAVAVASALTHVLLNTTTEPNEDGVSLEVRIRVIARRTAILTFCTFYSINEEQESNLSTILAISLTLVVAIIALSFCRYDRIVQKRNSVVVEAASRSSAIVDSLFPSNVRDRMMAERSTHGKFRKKTSNHTVRSFLVGGQNGTLEAKADESGYKTKPIADLFPETTIMVRIGISLEI